MQLTAHLPPDSGATATTAGPGPAAPSSRPSPRAKRSGGPEDHALYSCHCGYAFTAEVTTSVGCPHCGTSQAW